MKVLFIIFIIVDIVFLIKFRSAKSLEKKVISSSQDKSLLLEFVRFILSLNKEPPSNFFLMKKCRY